MSFFLGVDDVTPSGIDCKRPGDDLRNVSDPVRGEVLQMYQGTQLSQKFPTSDPRGMQRRTLEVPKTLR